MGIPIYLYAWIPNTVGVVWLAISLGRIERERERAEIAFGGEIPADTQWWARAVCRSWGLEKWSISQHLASAKRSKWDLHMLATKIRNWCATTKAVLFFFLCVGRSYAILAAVAELPVPGFMEERITTRGFISAALKCGWLFGDQTQLGVFYLFIFFGNNPRKVLSFLFCCFVSFFKVRSFPTKSATLRERGECKKWMSVGTSPASKRFGSW